MYCNLETYKKKKEIRIVRDDKFGDGAFGAS